MKKSLASNSILYGIKTLCSMLFPIITFPYISRILLDSGVGTYNFSTSVVSYFLLLASLGISTYGMRECAKVRNNYNTFCETASELFTINVVSAVISLLFLFFSLCFFSVLEEYRKVIVIISISIPLSVIGMEWIFNACEEYFYIAVRNIICQIVAIVMMFLFVRNTNDTWKYALITVFSTYGSNLINFYIIRKRYTIRLVWRKSMFHHLKPILTLFSAAIASQIYINSDITILGLLKGNSDVGIYSAATKIYNMVRSLLATLVTVVVPRLIFTKSNLGEKKYNGFWIQIKDLFLAILLPAVIGMLIMANEIILLLSGPVFCEAVFPLQILSIAMLFSCFGAFIANSILLIYSEERVLLVATIIGAVINLAMNCFFIPLWSYTGAAITTLIAEIVVFIIQLYYARKVSGLKVINLNLFKSLFCGAIMAFVVLVLGIFIKNILLKLLVCICIGAMVYVCGLFIMQHTEVKIVWNRVINIVKKRHTDN